MKKKHIRINQNKKNTDQHYWKPNLDPKMKESWLNFFVSNLFEVRSDSNMIFGIGVFPFNQCRFESDQR
jgi:hypothetical protein